MESPLELGEEEGQGPLSPSIIIVTSKTGGQRERNQAPSIS